MICTFRFDEVGEEAYSEKWNHLVTFLGNMKKYWNGQEVYKYNKLSKDIVAINLEGLNKVSIQYCTKNKALPFLRQGQIAFFFKNADAWFFQVSI